MEHRYPVVAGKDYAGTIESVGEGVTRFAPGDEVVGIVPNEPYLSRGSYAEYLVVPSEGFIERRPAGLDADRAASVGLAALTALLSVEAVDPSDGDLVLVAGATGGVGTYAVQLAAGRGATVIATSLPEDEVWIRGLGAAEVVDYSGDVAAAVREKHPVGVDAFIDAVQLGDGFGPIADLVKDGGRIATTVGAADAKALAGRGVGATNVMGMADPGPFAEVVRMAGEGSLTVPITRTFGRRAARGAGAGRESAVAREVRRHDRELRSRLWPKRGPRPACGSSGRRHHGPYNTVALTALVRTTVPQPRGARSTPEVPEEDALQPVGRQLDGRIREAAAGGLRIEALGVGFFALGVALAGWASAVA